MLGWQHKAEPTWGYRDGGCSGRLVAVLVGAGGRIQSYMIMLGELSLHAGIVEAALLTRDGPAWHGCIPRLVLVGQACSRPTLHAGGAAGVSCVTPRVMCDCGFCDVVQVGDLMSALKPRFQDANRNLGAQTLLLVASLAKAMGRPIAREARPILGPAIKCICDSKTQVWVPCGLACSLFMSAHSRRSLRCAAVSTWFLTVSKQYIVPDY